MGSYPVEKCSMDGIGTGWVVRVVRHRRDRGCYRRQGSHVARVKERGSPFERLPSTIQARIDDRIDAPLKTFKLIRIGKWNSISPNHSLAEFTNA